MTGDLAERPPRSFAFGPFVLIPERQLLLKGEAPVRIGSRALDILTALVERPGDLVSKRELISRAWPDTFVEEGNLKVNMAALRRALGEGPGKAQYIATVTGRGYRFVAPVQTSVSAGLALASTAAATGSHDLPTGTTRIFGRTDAIDAIRRDLDESRLVSIVGAGGIGKTTVAIAAAHAAARERADGAAFIDLATISDSQFVPAAIASALGLGMTGGDPLASVVHALKSQQKVLLFDNCEHLLPAVAAAVDRLARHLDDVRILTTSREPLRIRGERVHRLRGLECDPRESPTADEARQVSRGRIVRRARVRAGGISADGCRRPGSGGNLPAARRQCARHRACRDSNGRVLPGADPANAGRQVPPPQARPAWRASETAIPPRDARLELQPPFGARGRLAARHLRVRRRFQCRRSDGRVERKPRRGAGCACAACREVAAGDGCQRRRGHLPPPGNDARLLPRTPAGQRRGPGGPLPPCGACMCGARAGRERVVAASCPRMGRRLSATLSTICVLRSPGSAGTRRTGRCESG